MARLCRIAGVEALSYLGVRLHPSGEPTLKSYADCESRPLENQA